MKRFLRWLVSPLVIGTLGLLALSALLWWAGPLIAFGSSRPLEGLWVRVGLLLLIWLAWIARIAWVAEEAPVERVPASRTTAEWLVARMRGIGRSTARVVS